MQPEPAGFSLPDADVLLIVPPFTVANQPSIGVHMLQACAREEGIEVAVVYANLLFAAHMGDMDYQSICHAPYTDLLGERIFSHAAYGVETYQTRPVLSLASSREQSPTGGISFYWDQDRHRHFSGQALEWVTEFSALIARKQYRVVGASSCYQQTAASIALLDRVKGLRAQTTTILGGANCLGRMSDGIRSMGTSLDHVFSGECETVFVDFLKNLDADTHDAVILGGPHERLDELPLPDYAQFYEQYHDFCSNESTMSSDPACLVYEIGRSSLPRDRQVSGQVSYTKQEFRSRSPERMVQELGALLAEHPNDVMCLAAPSDMSSNHQEILQTLMEDHPDLLVTTAQEPPLTLDHARKLREAGVHTIHAEIDALTTTFLMAMKRGVTAVQNIALLRYARAVGIRVVWSLLRGFPGDRLEWYEKTRALLPYLAHLQPPSGVFPVTLDRHSPFFSRAPAFGVQHMRPVDAYFELLPPTANINALANYFEGDYPADSRTHPTVIAELEQKTALWRRWWMAGEPPELSVISLANDVFVITDTRGLPGADTELKVNQQQASMVLTGASDGDERYQEAWAIDHGFCIRVDGRLVPLATAEAALMDTFERAMKPNRTTNRRSAMA